MLKRMISLLLCAAMVFSMVPMQTIAMETEETVALAEKPESTAKEMKETELATEAPAEETETTETTEATEESASAEETMESVATSQPDDVEVKTDKYMPDPAYDEEELYEGYLNQLFFGKEESSTFGILARERLSTSSKYAYDKLKEAIIQIASGERSSLQVDIYFSYVGLRFDFDEWTKVIDALVHDCPYEMYWYWGCMISYYTDMSMCSFLLQPRPNYEPYYFNPNAPTINVTEARRAAAAAANAHSIVSQYASYGDYEKLCAYADKICSLVEYDYGAAYGGTSEDNINPWTLVNVFDNNTSTNVVCEGYSEAFQYLCDQSDFDQNIECYSATGNDHKWNIIRINGVSYLMDVTHCDNGNVADRGPKFFGGGQGSVTNGYQIGGFYYWYDQEIIDLWGSGSSSILKLSATPYSPTSPGIKTYSVVYDANGGVDAPAAQTKSHGVNLTLDSGVPYRFGYNFAGWATSAYATAPTYLPGGIYSGNANITLYAVWNTPELLDGDAVQYSRSVNIQYPYDGVFFRFHPNAHRAYRAYSDSEGDCRFFVYDINGNRLCSDDDSGGNRQFRLDFNYDGDAAFYLYVDFYREATGTVNFTIARGLEITYDANGGTGAPEREIQYYGFDTNLSNQTPTRTGFTFLGWSLDANAAAATYTPGVLFTANSDVTLYAVWRRDACSHSFGAYSETVAAGCLEPGTEVRTCTLCGETESREIPALGHRVTGSGLLETDPLEIVNTSTYPFELTAGTYYSTNKVDRSTSELKITAQYPCSLTLQYGVSSEDNYDKLIILKNGTTQSTISGDVVNQVLTLSLAVDDTVIVRYSKDGSVSRGQDRGWVKLVYDSVMVEGTGDIPAENMEPDCTNPVVCDYCGTVVKEALGHNYQNGACIVCGDAAYTYGQSAQIKLIEPWGLKANAKISTAGSIINYSQLYDYGVYFIRKSKLNRPGLSQDTITVDDILHDSDALKMTKNNGVTVSGGYLTATYDRDIYTYELADSIFVMFYFVTEAGADPVYVPIRERNLQQLVAQRKDDPVGFPNEKERIVYGYMDQLYGAIQDYREDYFNH